MRLKAVEMSETRLSGSMLPSDFGFRDSDFHRLIVAVIAPLIISAAAGCSSYADRVRDVRTQFQSGNLVSAEQVIAAELPKRRRAKEADALKLERAMIELSSGRAAEAERTLREVRDRFEYLEQKSLAEGTTSYLTDDTHRAYAGEDYEKVLIRAFLVLANLMHDGGDAQAYALQVNDKQRRIIEAGGTDAEQNPKLAYKRVALGAYVNGMLREATHRDYDDAAKAIQLVANWEPEFAPAKEDLERVTRGRHSAKGNGVLYVFTLVGRGPYKEERAEQPTQAAMLIVDHILSAIGKHTVTPTFAPVKVPVVVVPHNRVQSVRIAIDDQFFGTTETITDVGELAAQQFESVFPHVMARTIVRRAVKKGSLYAAKDALHVENPLAELAMDAVGVAWEASENADTRCWGLLPAKIQVRRIELPARSHSLSLQPAGHDNQPLGRPDRTEIDIHDGRNTYVLANFPGDKLVGRILVNHESQASALPNFGDEVIRPKSNPPNPPPEE